MRSKPAAFAEGVIRAFDITGDLKQYKDERRKYSGSLLKSWEKVGLFLTNALEKQSNVSGNED